ncbi:uncharacterized protein TRUGW13939_01284 [Talaromyces rugulosus]|uniref:SMODS and SLOG-associating 2TM effector domain-containing protein n=1 Tax=Talaromyces rugulosus TaxID=121627 RepID=A0A7H8QJT0_TALRU|nr:uncharacterized protein TRUGW13939_01284 [Talaromyces rugulosus]QKX54199.1 hypothetical protein TRUGW13939_01284 [Talaromyces rugulosus]
MPPKPEDHHEEEEEEQEDPTESSPLLPKSDKNSDKKANSKKQPASPPPPAPAQDDQVKSVGPPIEVTPSQPASNDQQPTNGSQKPPQQSWPTPAGLPPREDNDERLIIFRRAVGINYHLAATDPGTMEEGRKKAVGIYRAVISAKKSKARQFYFLSTFTLLCHFGQIIVGAALTALGPLASDHTTIITFLGAFNTVIAGMLALISGQGLPDRIKKDQIGFRKIQDWIEETESLLSVGIIGRNRKEVGLLVEEAFKKYNVAKTNEENNRPDSYVNSPEEPSRVSGDIDNN